MRDLNFTVEKTDCPTAAARAFFNESPKRETPQSKVDGGVFVTVRFYAGSLAGRKRKNGALDAVKL